MWHPRCLPRGLGVWSEAPGCVWGRGTSTCSQKSGTDPAWNRCEQKPHSAMRSANLLSSRLPGGRGGGREGDPSRRTWAWLSAGRQGPRTGPDFRDHGDRAAGAAPPGGRAWWRGVAEPGGRFAGRSRPAGDLGYFVTAPSTQASLPPLNETPLLRDVQPLHLIKEIALQC